MNKIILIGHLCNDPILKTMPSGISLCSFGIAVNRRVKTEGQSDVDFFNITAWRGLADNCAKFLEKGRKACVVGQVQIRTYDAKDGTKRTAVDVVADEVEFLSPPREFDAHRGMGGPSTGGVGGVVGTQPVHDDGFVQVDMDDELPF